MPYLPHGWTRSVAERATRAGLRPWCLPVLAQQHDLQATVCGQEDETRGKYVAVSGSGERGALAGGVLVALTAVCAVLALMMPYRTGT